MSKLEKSPTVFSTHSEAQIQEAKDNLTRCLDAYDQRGEVGLDDELERINPSPALTRLGLRRVSFMTSSHSIVSDKSYMPAVRAASSTPVPNGNPN